MKRSRNAIFKYTIVLGAAMSLSACNGIFENIYDAPIETEMEIKENSFSQVKTVEYTEDFVEDEWTTDKIAIDMSGMMDGNIIYTESYRNAVLSSWLDVNTATMPPVYTMSNQVFLIRLKDNTYAAIRFTNYMNARGIKGYIDFDFQYPLEFEDNNNETNQQE